MAVLFPLLDFYTNYIAQLGEEKLQGDQIEAFQYLKELYGAMLSENFLLKSGTICFFKHLPVQTKPTSFPFH